MWYVIVVIVNCDVVWAAIINRRLNANVRKLRYLQCLHAPNIHTSVIFLSDTLSAHWLVTKLLASSLAVYQSTCHHCRLLILLLLMSTCLSSPEAFFHLRARSLACSCCFYSVWRTDVHIRINKYTTPCNFYSATRGRGLCCIARCLFVCLYQPHAGIMSKRLNVKHCHLVVVVSHTISRDLLHIWEFVYFVCGLSPPKRRVVRRRNFAHRRVPTMCRTCAGFYVYRGRRYENNDIFLKLRKCRPRLCCADGSVGSLGLCY